MKKLLFYAMTASLLLAMAGCQSNILPSSNTLIPSDGKLTIQATFEIPSFETKTTLDENGHFTWNPKDAISLFYGSGTKGGSKFVSDLESNDRISSFSGNISAVTGVSESSADDLMFWGLYPYDPDASCDGQTVTTTLKPEQVGMANSFAPGMAPSLGRAPGLLLAFRNIYSGLTFTVTEPGFVSLTFSSNGGENIAGRAKIGIGSDSNPEVREYVDGTNVVTLTAPTTDGFEVGKTYYLLFYPQTLSSGFKLELKSAAKTGVLQLNSSFNFRRNLPMSANNLDKNMTFTSQPNTEIIQGGSNPDISW